MIPHELFYSKRFILNRNKIIGSAFISTFHYNSYKLDETDYLSDFD